MKIEEFENIFGNVPFDIDNLKKINKYIKDNYVEKSELEKKDKIIDAMAEYIDDTQMEVGKYYKNKQEVIEYFTKKVEDD